MHSKKKTSRQKGRSTSKDFGQGVTNIKAVSTKKIKNKNRGSQEKPRNKRSVQKKLNLEKKIDDDWLLNLNDKIETVLTCYSNVKRKFRHLEEAFTHRTFAHEFNQKTSSKIKDNQRLEFLGDSILGQIATTKLFVLYPILNEGQLSAKKAYLINKTTLMKLAVQLDLDEYLRIGKGEAKMGEAARVARLADLMEALIGASYLDCGLQETTKWLWPLLLPFLDEEDKLSPNDPKTALQHWAHQTFHITPKYNTWMSSGATQEKLYCSEVILQQQIIGQGKGITKKLAEREAAIVAYENRLKINFLENS